MAKESGLGMTTLAIDDSGGDARNIRNDITNFDLSTPRNTQEVTGLDSMAVERLLLLGDFSANYTGVFNPASNMSHAVLSTVTSASVTRTITHTVSGQTLAVEALITDYQLTRAATGELTWTAPAVLQSGTAPNWTS